MSISRRKFIKQGLAAGLAASVSLSPVRMDAKKGKSAKKGGLAKRVLIVTFDGIRVDALAKARTPNIDRLICEGAASMATRDVMPSITLPNYTSHLTGAGPEVHGVATNDWKVDKYTLEAVQRDADGYFPSSFSVLKEKAPDVKTAFFWNWKPLIYPYNPKAFDETVLGAEEEYGMLCDKAFDFIKANRDSRQFVFLYTVHTDEVGHRLAWMSDEYIKSIEEEDAKIGLLFEKLKAEGLYEGTHIMFFSDHGGVGKGHGGVSPEEMIVPWVLRGPGIKKGFEITEANNTVNTASTVLRLFGVEQPLCWTGEVPESIFE